MKYFLYALLMCGLAGCQSYFVTLKSRITDGSEKVISAYGLNQVLISERYSEGFKIKDLLIDAETNNAQKLEEGSVFLSEIKGEIRQYEREKFQIDLYFYADHNEYMIDNISGDLVFDNGTVLSGFSKSRDCVYKNSLRDKSALNLVSGNRISEIIIKNKQRTCMTFIYSQWVDPKEHFLLHIGNLKLMTHPETEPLKIDFYPVLLKTHIKKSWYK